LTFQITLLSTLALLSAAMWIITRNNRLKFSAFLFTQIMISSLFICLSGVLFAFAYFIISLIFALGILFFDPEFQKSSIFALLKNPPILWLSALVLMITTLIAMMADAVRNIILAGKTSTYLDQPITINNSWIFVLLISIFFILLTIIFKGLGERND